MEIIQTIILLLALSVSLTYIEDTIVAIKYNKDAGWYKLPTVILWVIFYYLLNK